MPKLIGQVYKLKPKFHDPMDDEYIVMEELNTIVALVNNRTNHVSWATRHTLNLEFDKKGQK